MASKHDADNSASHKRSLPPPTQLPDTRLGEGSRKPVRSIRKPAASPQFTASQSTASQSTASQFTGGQFTGGQLPSVQSPHQPPLAPSIPNLSKYSQLPTRGQALSKQRSSKRLSSKRLSSKRLSSKRLDFRMLNLRLRSQAPRSQVMAPLAAK